MTVYLVGAGPGDPGLITVKGASLLGRAEVLVHDRLVNPELLDLVPEGCERISAAKEPRRPTMTQDEINALLVERGRAGQFVVRLKGGDPFVFARGGEEAHALAAAGVGFEVVPGITSAVAAPAYAGIPVTMRHEALSVTFVTGHADPASGKVADWDALAKVGGTIVVLMGASRAADIARDLAAGGLDPSTAAAWVHWGTYDHQHVWRGKLAELGDEPVPSPAILVIGTVAATDLTWFHALPSR
ncbi:MAG: uroporphyrinogen-III C-methyltransferase [Actinomycetota bacterium]|nr:uroporphyrinogen-III C-methyltransferase [Actinomycetota bacterium]